MKVKSVWVCICIYNVCAIDEIDCRRRTNEAVMFGLVAISASVSVSFSVSVSVSCNAQSSALGTRRSAFSFQMQFCANAAIKIESIMNLTLPPFVVHVKWIRTNGSGARSACSCPILVFAISIAWPEQQILIDWQDSTIVRNFKYGFEQTNDIYAIKSNAPRRLVAVLCLNCRQTKLSSFHLIYTQSALNDVRKLKQINVWQHLFWERVNNNLIEMLWLPTFRLSNLLFLPKRCTNNNNQFEMTIIHSWRFRFAQRVLSCRWETICICMYVSDGLIDYCIHSK